MRVCDLFCTFVAFFMTNRRIDIGSQSLELAQPCVMGIINCTSDSFYAASRVAEADVVATAERMINEGAAILDIGGCSTRPNSQPAEEAEEWRRVEPALRMLRQAMPEIPLSLDTFRVSVARRALDTFGPMIINDISGGSEDMYRLVSEYDVPYILTNKPVPTIEGYHRWIVDPGLGFLGSTEADYRTLSGLQRGEYPILVGLSRKSMIYKPLGITPEETLAPTQALHMAALMHGADILRVHDVLPAVQTIRLFTMLDKKTI